MLYTDALTCSHAHKRARVHESQTMQSTWGWYWSYKNRKHTRLHGGFLVSVLGFYCLVLFFLTIQVKKVIFQYNGLFVFSCYLNLGTLQSMKEGSHLRITCLFQIEMTELCMRGSSQSHAVLYSAKVPCEHLTKVLQVQKHKPELIHSSTHSGIGHSFAFKCLFSFFLHLITRVKHSPGQCSGGDPWGPLS